MGATTTRTPEPAEQERPFSGDLGWLLARTSDVLSTEMTSAFERLGIAPREHCVLSAALSGTYTQKELAEMIGLDKTTMVVTLDELERKGLAERRPSETDRRARIVNVTAAGKRTLAKGRQIAAAVQDDVLGSLPAGERRALLSALEHLAGGRLASPAECARAPRRRL